MVRVELEIPEDDQAEFTRQARLEGMTLDAWLLKVARQRVEKRKPEEQIDSEERFKSVEELRAFFIECSGRDGPEKEPDWEDFKKSYIEYRRPSLPDV